VEDIVDIGCDNQLRHRQAHLRGDIARENVAEIAGRHAVGDLPMRRAQLQSAGKVIHHLRHQPRPVDRIDRTDVEALSHLRIAEHALHHCLRIVKAAFNRDIMHVGRTHRGHLAALNLAYASLWVKHEDVHPFAPGHRIDRG